MFRLKSFLILACAAQMAAPLLQAEEGPTFLPDATFKGSTLTGWHTAGSAKWTAANGEITARGGEGWLVLDKSYQDAALYTSFRCTAACNTGILMRMEKTPEGSTGVFLAIEGEALTPYRVNIDANGKITSKTKLRNAGGQARYAPPPPPPGAARRAPAAVPALPDPPAGVTLMPHPERGIKAGSWNQIEVLLDAEIIRAFLNDGGGEASAAAENMTEYGPIALYVGAGAEVSFKDVAYKNLGIKSQPEEKVGDGFRMQRVNPFFYGWSAAAADFNHDGKIDIIAGPFIYYGPDFLTSSEIYPNEAYNTSTQYPAKDWIQAAADFNGDGWTDVLTSGRGVGADLYINPGDGEIRRWKHYHVVESIFGEETIVRDIDGDGKQELIYTSGDGYISYAKPDPAKEGAPWTIRHVSEKGPWPPHGIGAGDVNQDGKLDILDGEGWWEQPKTDDGKPWKFHAVAFGRWARTSAGGCDMGVYDVNGDGLPDVVTTLQSHGWGLAWFEQKRTKDGEISFVKHQVMGMHGDKNNAGGVSFSQPHGTTTADVDGDGIPDYIVGKRLWSHLDDFYDPDPYGPAVLYWYKTVRNPKAPGGAELIPHLIHNRSGAGSDVLALDLNGDKKIDIVTVTRSGTYIFWGAGAAASRKAK